MSLIEYEFCGEAREFGLSKDTESDFWVIKVLRSFCLLFLVSSLAYAQGTRMNVAVSNFDSRGLTLDETLIITDRVRSELIRSGDYLVMERSKMDLILKEQSFQESGVCNSSECQVEMGQLLGIDQIITGEVGKFGGMYTLSARMMEVQTGQIIKSITVDHEGKIEGLLKFSVPKLVSQLSPNAVSTKTVSLEVEEGSTLQSDPQTQAAAAVQQVTQEDKSNATGGMNFKLTSQIGLGVVGTALAVAAYLQETKMQGVNSSIQQNQANYRSASESFNSYHIEARRLDNLFQTEKEYQQIFSIASATAFGALALTFAF